MFKETGKKVNKDTASNAKDYELKRIDTTHIIWHVIKRHRFGLVSAWAVVITILYVFPPAPDLILSMF